MLNFEIYLVKKRKDKEGKSLDKMMEDEEEEEEEEENEEDGNYSPPFYYVLFNLTPNCYHPALYLIYSISTSSTSSSTTFLFSLF